MTDLVGNAAFPGCTCDPGFVWNTTTPGNEAYCADIDECKDYGCGSTGATCTVDRINARNCICPALSTGTRYGLVGNEAFPGCTCNTGYEFNTTSKTCVDIDECAKYKCDPSGTATGLFKGNCSAPAINRRSCTCPGLSTGTQEYLVADTPFYGCSCFSGYRPNNTFGYYFCQDIPECAEIGCPANKTGFFAGVCTEELLNTRSCNCGTGSFGSVQYISSDTPFDGCECPAGFNSVTDVDGKLICEVCLLLSPNSLTLFRILRSARFTAARRPPATLPSSTALALTWPRASAITSAPAPAPLSPRARPVSSLRSRAPIPSLAVLARPATLPMSRMASPTAAYVHLCSSSCLPRCSCFS